MRRGGRQARPVQPVAVATLSASPIGDLQVAVSEHGLCRVGFGAQRSSFEAGLLDDGYGPLVEDPTRTTPVLEQLSAYLAGRRATFDLPLDLRGRSSFEEEVLRATVAVPAGSVTTYARLAATIGRPRAYRAVGNALHHNPVPVVIPCHRVVSTDGSLRGYAGGLHIKDALLRLERAMAS
jgi:O-6-methylguanine DNA methyltransferase